MRYRREMISTACTQWVHVGYLGGYFLKIPNKYPVGKLRANWWENYQSVGL